MEKEIQILLRVGNEPTIGHIYKITNRINGKIYNIDKYTVKGILVRHNIELRTKRIYKFTKEDLNNIITDIRKGYPRNQIINKYKISRSYLSQLITGSRRI